MKTPAVLFIAMLWLILAQGALDADDRGSLVYEVQAKQTMNYYEAMGTIRPRYEPAISSQIQAAVLDILVHPGDRVKPGELMILLDNREYESRLNQAMEQLQAARAAVRRSEQQSAKARALLDELSLKHQRFKNLYAEDVISSQEYEKTASAYHQARADYEQSLMAIQEAQFNKVSVQEKTAELRIMLDYTQIRAPERGEVVQRLVNPGDTASPGKVLLLLQSRHLLRMEAQVPERLVSGLHIGQEYEVRVDSLHKTYKATLTEIVPRADAAARSFLVKLDLKSGESKVYPGMFARMFVPLEHEEIIFVPAGAVRYTGQLQTVTVIENGETYIRHVRSGRKFQEYIEILSGLNAGEKIIVEKDGSF